MTIPAPDWADEIAKELYLGEDWTDIAAALRKARQDALEEAAVIADNGVHESCCGKYEYRAINFTVHGEVGEFMQDCCGNPDVMPMYPNEIADAIRARKTTSKTAGDKP